MEINIFRKIVTTGLVFLFSLPVVRANESVGSVLGSVSHDSARIWAYAEEGEELSVKLCPSAETASEIVKSDFSATSYFIELSKLSADTEYTYEVSINGEVSPLSSGKFTTNPLPGEASKFTVAVISCLKRTTPDWSILEKEKPSYLLMLGDNIYTYKSKRDSFETMRDLYLGFRKNQGFTDLVKNRSTLTVWDDHDMGPNNCNGTLEGKEESLKAFKDVWPNPSYGKEDVPGVFYTKQHGDVDFFMLDVRYHRQSKRDKEARMLGDQQFEWLINELKKSDAPFKIIAGGSPINHAELKDGWENWPWARDRLYGEIIKNKITGVLFLGGDLHFADLEKIPTEKTNIPYPIYNIVSSGFASEKSRKGWHYSKQKNPYVLLNIDTTLDDPTLQIQVKDRDQTYTEVTVKASELQ